MKKTFTKYPSGYVKASRELNEEVRPIDANALKLQFADMRDGYPMYSSNEMISVSDLVHIIDSAPTI